jgi:hypothetical protein
MAIGLYPYTTIGFPHLYFVRYNYNYNLAFCPKQVGVG